MISMVGKSKCPSVIEALPAQIRPALSVLLEALVYAEQTGATAWEFAVEMDELTALGLTRNDFRWLVRGGLVEHQREVTIEGDDGRAFRPTGDLTFPEGTCFMLTEKGVSVASEMSQSTTRSRSPSSNLYDQENRRGTIIHRVSAGGTGRNGESTSPRWDPDRRELCIDETVVKRFRWAAANQEAILAAFEEEDWPARIDDPLPPHPEQDSKRRLSDTIRCLNRKQIDPLIHFRGDGTGEGILWEFAKPDSEPNVAK